jgi:hypothetical protein
MSINMIERNGSDCEYIEFFTHRVGSIDDPSRTVFIRSTNSTQREVPKIARRNTKANIFQKGSARFEATAGKVKISLYRPWKPIGCERLRLPHYLDKRLIDGGKVVSPTRQPDFTPRFIYFKDSWYSFLLQAESTPGS